MKEQKYRTFEEFWPHYVREHAKKGTRNVHFAGTTAAIACVAGALLLRKRSLLALAPLAGYGAAWIAHAFIEKNVPATFTYPLWSLRADFVMWSKVIRGTMDAEVERAMSSNGHHDTPTDIRDAARAAALDEMAARRERDNLN